MKLLLSLTLGALCLTATSGLPASSAPQRALPAEVKSLLPQGTTSFLLQQLPIGDKGAPNLVHIWGAVRANTPDSGNSYNRFLDSPFCVDIFERQFDSKHKSHWHLASSATYTDVAPPTRVVNRWLRPATQQGPLLEIISGNGAPGLSTLHTLFVWNKGFRTGYTPPTAQTFCSGGTGGGHIDLKFGVDARGYTTIERMNFASGKLVSTTKYRWNGERFAAIKVLS